MVLLFGAAARWLAQTDAKTAHAGGPPVLINTCLISKDVKTLGALYQKVLNIEPQFSGDNYAEFRTGAGVLAIFDAAAQERYIPGSAIAGANKSAIIEFRVDNVDAEYAEIAERGEDVGEGSDNATLGNAVDLLPGSGRESG